MIAAIPTATCFHHTDRETGRSCTRCGRPACSDCLREAPVGSHCWECVKAAQPPARERLRRWNAQSAGLVTRTLIAINVAVFVLTSIGGGSLSGAAGKLHARLALYGPAVSHGEWYRLVTSGFVHYGLLHLAFNMVLLYRVGEALEGSLGRVRFVILYFVSLLAGSFGALLLSPNTYTAGASGAVFGLFAAMAIAQRRSGVDVWRNGIGGLIVLNLVITFTAGNISIGGHLGGLVGGAVVGALMFQARA
jgi:membrane associated rhomboid family serine protease